MMTSRLRIDLFRHKMTPMGVVPKFTKGHPTHRLHWFTWAGVADGCPCPGDRWWQCVKLLVAELDRSEKARRALEAAQVRYR
jgi:hypothetical protein